MTTKQGFKAAALALGLTVSAFGLSAGRAHAETVLSGAWSGSGSLVLPSGATEKARCKVSFNKSGGKSYGMNAVCASSSAKVAQTAMLAQVGPNKYVGEFTNQEFGVTGTISLTVNGSSLSANLQGGGGSAVFNLSR
jgi:hypothetical protein